jgi:hypothetical protein
MGEIQPYRARPSPDEAQQAKLLLSSSLAVALAANDAAPAEVAAALRADERAALPVALADVRAQLAVVEPDDPEAELKDQVLSGEIMQAIVNISPNMAEDRKADWVSSQMVDFEREPYELVLEGVRAARRSCRHPGDFGPSVIGHVIVRKARLQAEADRLDQLQRVAG